MKTAVAPLLASPEHLDACRPDLQQLREDVKGRINELNSYYWQEVLRRLDWILWGLPGQDLPLPAGCWGDLIWATFQDMDPALRLPWITLVQQCMAPRESPPSQEWRARILYLIEGVGQDAFCRQVRAWLEMYSRDYYSAPLLFSLLWGVSRSVLSRSLMHSKRSCTVCRKLRPHCRAFAYETCCVG